MFMFMGLMVGVGTLMFGWEIGAVGCITATLGVKKLKSFASWELGKVMPLLTFVGAGVCENTCEDDWEDDCEDDCEDVCGDGAPET